MNLGTSGRHVTCVAPRPANNVNVKEETNNLLMRAFSDKCKVVAELGRRVNTGGEDKEEI